MIRKKTSDAVDEPVKKTASRKTTAKVSDSVPETAKPAVKKAAKSASGPAAKTSEKKTPKISSKETVLEKTASEKAPKPVAKKPAATKTKGKAAVKMTEKKTPKDNTGSIIKKVKPAITSDEVQVSVSKVRTKKASVSGAGKTAPKKAVNGKTSMSESEKTAKASKSVKIEVESPLYPKSPTAVTSSHTENIYGRHYIIDTAQDLPQNYGKDRLVVLARDPEWIFAFWEISEARMEDLKRALKSAELPKGKIIRVYDISESGSEAVDFFDIEVSGPASSWYINVRPDSVYNLELGVRSASGEFITVLKSNPVSTPRHGMSPNVDEKWMIKDEHFEKIYELSGGHSVGMSSADIMQAMARGMKPGEFSEINPLSSHVLGASSDTFSSEMMQAKKEEEEKKLERKFWMVVNTELIVYGATEPDASVTIMGTPVKLRTDGTFSIRFALPDGDIDIPVKGVSADRIDEITITPSVQKQTSYHKK